MTVQHAILAAVVALAIVVLWVAMELRKLNNDLSPILNSSLGRGLASI